MMKKLFYVLIGLCAFCSCESTGYRISGYIPGGAGWSESVFSSL